MILAVAALSMGSTARALAAPERNVLVLFSNSLLLGTLPTLNPLSVTELSVYPEAVFCQLATA